MRSVIVGTAGHIDHGKTTLVRALTGVDADRLPEEKRRGITIDLGFAELDLGDVRVGFVDVPGHERFVKNMLAGAHGDRPGRARHRGRRGRDAADARALRHLPSARRRVRPRRPHQDRRGRRGAARARPRRGRGTRRRLVSRRRARRRRQLAHGAGHRRVEGDAASRWRGRAPPRSSDAVARLPVDRAFTMRGFGAVVTGTLVAGEIREGDELELLPGGDARARARPAGPRRAVTHGAAPGSGRRSTSAAWTPRRSSAGWCSRPSGDCSPTQIIDARVEVLADAPRRLRSRSRVRVHLGTAEVLARVAALEEAGEIAPGAAGFAQLRLEVAGRRAARRALHRPLLLAAADGRGRRSPRRAREKHRGRDRARRRARGSPRSRGADAPRALAFFVETAGERGLAARRGGRAHGLARRSARDAASRRGDSGAARVEAEGVRRRARDLRAASSRAARRGGRGTSPARAARARAGARDAARARVRARRARAVPRRADAKREGARHARRRARAGARARRTASNSRPRTRRCATGSKRVYRDAALEAPALEEALARARRRVASASTRASSSNCCSTRACSCRVTR